LNLINGDKSWTLLLDVNLYQSDSVKECCNACGVDIAGQTALAQCYTKNVTGSSRSKTGFVDFSNTSWPTSGTLWCHV